jgi:hypothetical protein
MAEKYKQVIDILAKAKTDAKELLTSPEDEVHELHISHTLQTEINRLALLTNTGQVESSPHQKLEPATTILGSKIELAAPTAPEDLKAKKSKVDELKEKVDEAYELFPQKTNEEILSNMDDLVVRGVAKKAGLKISKDSPEKLDSAFIDQIKEAIANSKK